jgi:hypothetical protein
MSQRRKGSERTAASSVFFRVQAPGGTIPGKYVLTPEPHQEFRLIR